VLDDELPRYTEAFRRLGEYSACGDDCQRRRSHSARISPFISVQLAIAKSAIAAPGGYRLPHTGPTATFCEEAPVLPCALKSPG
jgi:hypothetical protein